MQKRMTMRRTTCLIMALGLSAVTGATALGQNAQNAQNAQDAQGGMSAMPGMDMPAVREGTPSVRIGPLEISAAFAKAMLPGQPVGGGYLTIRNGGTADDRLLSVTSAAAGRVELHEMTMQGQVMKMRRLDGGIDLPAGRTVSLTSGGTHMMFMQVKAPFHQGDKVPVTLTFEKAGSAEVILDVRSLGGD